MHADLNLVCFKETLHTLFPKILSLVVLFGLKHLLRACTCVLNHENLLRPIHSTVIFQVRPTMYVIHQGRIKSFANTILIHLIQSIFAVGSLKAFI